MKTEFAYRYAIYFVPALHSAWWAAGSHWLGRCAATGQSLKQPLITGMASNAFVQITQEPRRYGWHATLKAPFELKLERSVAALLQAVENLAQELPAFDLPLLQVSTEGGFMALRPLNDASAIEATAAACVTRLHDFAKPLSPDDLARRRQSPLTPAQDQLLVQWGYPWVLDEFQFHLSLTGPLHKLSDAERQALTQAAQAHFDSLTPCRFENMAVFVEPEKGADFQWLHSVALSAK